MDILFTVNLFCCPAVAAHYLDAIVIQIDHNRHRAARIIGEAE